MATLPGAAQASERITFCGTPVTFRSICSCHLAFNAPLRTRRERADRLKRERQDFFDRFAPEARAVLNDLLDKYTEQGTTQLQFPDALKIPPISERGSVMEIASYFGGPDQLRSAVHQLQSILYAA